MLECSKDIMSHYLSIVVDFFFNTLENCCLIHSVAHNFFFFLANRLKYFLFIRCYLMLQLVVLYMDQTWEYLRTVYNLLLLWRQMLSVFSESILVNYILKMIRFFNEEELNRESISLQYFSHSYSYSLVAKHIWV